MSTTLLVAYATRYGSTREVAEAIAESLRESGFPVDLQPARGMRTLAGYSAVVLGAPLLMYRWHKDAHRFLLRHRDALKERLTAVFALGPTHEPYDEQEWRESRAQLEKELARYPWFSPAAIQVMGGAFDPAKLRFPINLLAGKEPATDIRDWPAIRTWATSVANNLK